MRISPDDSEMGPDVVCKMNEQQIGIQITRFTISGAKVTKRVAQQNSIKILKNIFPRIKPSERTIVSFNSIFDRSNEIVKLKKKKLNKLCDFIVKEVSKHKNIYKGRKELEYFLYPFTIEVPDFLKPEITSILIQYPPADQEIYVPGRGNIYINFNFDTRSVSDLTIQEVSELIYKKKNNGKSEILLIWGDTTELFNQDEKIISSLKGVFKETSFMNVFYISLRNMDDGYSKNFNFTVIK